MVDPNLPADLVAFIHCGKQPDYNKASCEAGAVEFLTLDKLKVEFFPMTPESPDDPHAGECGSYLVPGVSLISVCDNYDPVGLLLWLPLDRRYGTWDGEHGTLRVFPEEVDWSMIANDLPHYINSQWGLEGSAPLTEFVPWGHHPHNAEQLYRPLPDISEWYEAQWLRRGVYRDGVQLRYPEELRIRIERDDERFRLTLWTKKAENGAEWSTPQELAVAPDTLDRMSAELDRGFWNQPESAPGGPGGEPSTSWSFEGYRPGEYRMLFRFYEEDRDSGEPVHELGRALARLAKVQHFEAND